MDYMMARCVVLHSVEAGNDPVAEAGCGLTVPPESPLPWPTACAPGRAAGRRAQRHGRARERLRARPPHLPGAGAALPGGRAMNEPDAVAERYARRAAADDRYSPLRPEVAALAAGAPARAAAG
jgi:hypothetical protein